MKKLLTAMLSVLLLAPNSVAWNKAGHMVSGAIAYSVLKTEHPKTLAKAMALFRAHPEYQSRWENALGGLEDSPGFAADHDLFIFMLAARWSDDIRGIPAFHHGNWHYINYPLAFESGIPTREPEPENIVSAFERNSALVSAAATPPADKAISLCWLFHLVGDVHQPLHTTALFSSEFPNGDRGGNLFKVAAEEGGQPIDLHSFWDGLVTGTEDYRHLKNRAIEIRSNSGLQRPHLAEYKDASFTDWAKIESFAAARDVTYEKGALKPGSTLTEQYRKDAKAVAERRVALAGYRLADLLVRLLGD